MKITSDDCATPTFARLIGVVYLLIAIIGGSAYFLVSQSLIAPGNAVQTAEAIRENIPLLRMGITAYLAILALDVLMAWLLFRLFAGTDKPLSMLAAWMRLTYVCIHGAAVLNLASVLRIADGGLGAMPIGSQNDMILIYAQAHLDGFMISLMFFGFHLLFISYLIWKSDLLPKTFGIFLAIAGLAYIGDTLIMVLLENYTLIQPQLEPFVAIAAMIGEIGLLLWLLIMGVKSRA